MQEGTAPLRLPVRRPDGGWRTGARTRTVPRSVSGESSASVACVFRKHLRILSDVRREHDIVFGPSKVVVEVHGCW